MVDPPLPAPGRRQLVPLPPHPAPLLLLRTDVHVLGRLAPAHVASGLLGRGGGARQSGGRDRGRGPRLVRVRAALREGGVPQTRVGLRRVNVRLRGRDVLVVA